MKNVTISLEEKVARWVRVWAAEHDTSVSRFVGDLLKSRMQDDQQYQRSKTRYLSREPKLLKSGGGYPARDEVHDRSLLR